MRLGSKSIWRSAVAIACSFVTRTWSFWQVWATTKASDEHTDDHQDARPGGPDRAGAAFAQRVGRNSFPMFVKSTIIRTMITHMIEIANIAISNAFT